MHLWEPPFRRPTSWRTIDSARLSLCRQQSAAILEAAVLSFARISSLARKDGSRAASVARESSVGHRRPPMLERLRSQSAGALSAFNPLFGSLRRNVQASAAASSLRTSSTPSNKSAGQLGKQPDAPLPVRRTRLTAGWRLTMSSASGEVSSDDMDASSRHHSSTTGSFAAKCTSTRSADALLEPARGPVRQRNKQDDAASSGCGSSSARSSSAGHRGAHHAAGDDVATRTGRDSLRRRVSRLHEHVHQDHPGRPPALEPCAKATETSPPSSFDSGTNRQSTSSAMKPRRSTLLSFARTGEALRQRLAKRAAQQRLRHFHAAEHAALRHLGVVQQRRGRTGDYDAAQKLALPSAVTQQHGPRGQQFLPARSAYIGSQLMSAERKTSLDGGFAMLDTYTLDDAPASTRIAALPGGTAASPTKPDEADARLLAAAVTISALLAFGAQAPSAEAARPAAAHGMSDSAEAPAVQSTSEAAAAAVPMPAGASVSTCLLQPCSARSIDQQRRSGDAWSAGLQQSSKEALQRQSGMQRSDSMRASWRMRNSTRRSFHSAELAAPACAHPSLLLLPPDGAVQSTCGKSVSEGAALQSTSLQPSSGLLAAVQGIDMSVYDDGVLLPNGAGVTNLCTSAAALLAEAERLAQQRKRIVQQQQHMQAAMDTLWAHRWTLRRFLSCMDRR